MPYFENNGARIYYEKKGAWESGRYPVLLLHGNGESMEIFDKTIEPISYRFPFLAIDTRGHGKSELLNENYDFSYRMFADDVKALVRSLDINQMDIVGFSDGAIIALLLASDSEFAARIMRIVAVGANTNPKGLKGFAHSKIALDKRIADAKGNKLESALCALMLREPDISSDELARIYASVAVVVGSNDIIKPAHTDRLVSSIMHARLIVIDGADHMIPQKFPERLRGVMLDELD